MNIAAMLVAAATACLFAVDVEAQVGDLQHWKPLCSGAHPPRAVINRIAARHAGATAQAPLQVITPSEASGLALHFEITGQPPPGATEAFAAIADLYSGLIADELDLTISVLFEPLGMYNGLPILGATGDSYSSLTYPSVRAALIAGMDSDDVIEQHLPDVSALRIIYGLEPGAREEDRGSLLTGVALRLLLDGQAPTPIPMSLSSTAPWDTDPSDGIDPGAYCFRSVIAHEIAHALGFQSNVDLLFGATLLPMDIYRFRETDGGRDLNPDTYARFSNAPRTVYRDDPNPPDEDEAILDFIAAEIPVADGDPWQGSHLRRMTPALGVMDPDIDPGETAHPTYLTAADLRPLDALGWTILVDGCYPDCDQSTGPGNLDIFDFLCFQDAFATADPYADCDNNTVLDVFDFLCFQDAFANGCP
jgi:hypothetical protein